LAVPVNAIRGLLDIIARLTTEFEAAHLSGRKRCR